MLEKKADDELRVEQRLAVMDSEIEHLPSDAADFTVCGFVQLSAILYLCQKRLELTKGKNEREVSHLACLNKGLLMLRLYPSLSPGSNQ